MARQSYGRLSLFMVVFMVAASLVVSAPGRALAGGPSLQDAQTAPVTGRSVSSPLQVGITASPLPDSRAVVTLHISTTVALDDIRLDVELGSELRLLSGRAPRRIALEKHQARTFDLVVQGSSTEPGQVQAYVQATFGGGTTGDLDRIWLTARDGALNVVPEPAGTAPSGDQGEQPSSEDASMTLDETGTLADIPDTQVSPGAIAATVTIKGVFEYRDHLVSPSGVSSTATNKKIRRAYVFITRFISQNNTPTVATGYTNNSGAYSFTVTSSNITIGSTKLRAHVCTKGPDSANLLSVEKNEMGGSLWCYQTSELTAQATTDFGTKRLDDTHEGSGPFNIYDTILAAYDLLNNAVGKPTTKLTVIWYKGFNPIGSNNGSYFGAGRVNLNGTSSNGDQWDDFVIVHEVGHWVSEVYVQTPPDVIGPHGACDDGDDQPNVSYYEGWATFFAAATLNSLGHPWASRYLDTNDDGGGIGTTKVPVDVPLETTPIMDQTATVDFRKGNFCEWQVAAVLWDVIDSNADNHDTLQQPFANVFKAFQTPYNTGHPWNINEWWYGWTNTLGKRSGGSFGSEQAMLDNFADHKIQVGVRFELRWGATPTDLDANLWLPQSKAYQVWRITPGSYTSSPYAGFDVDDTDGFGPETIWMTSPYQGTYVYAPVDFADYYDNTKGMAGTNAQVKVYDGSQPLIKTYTVPASGTGDWWYVLDLNGATSMITVKNQVQVNSPAPYTIASNGQDTPIGPKKTTPTPK